MKFELKTLVQESCTLDSIKEHDHQMVAMYTTTSGFKFPVPVAEMALGTFNATERGFTLMRWIKKALVALETSYDEMEIPG